MDTGLDILGIRRKKLPLKIRYGQRAAVIVALAVITAKLYHHLFILLGLHTLCHSTDVQLLGKLQNAGHDLALAAVCILGGTHQEQTVQLQFIDFQPSQGVQRGIAAAEVIHGNSETGGSQLLNAGIDVLHMVQNQTFQNLQRNTVNLLYLFV